MDFDGALSSQLDSVTLGNTFKVSASNLLPCPPRHLSQQSSDTTTSCKWEDPVPSPLLAPRWTLWDRAGDLYARWRARRSSPHSQRHNNCQFSFAGGIIFCLILQLLQSSSGFPVRPATASLVGSMLTAALLLLTTVSRTEVRIIDRVTTGHVRMMVAPLCLGRTSHVEQAVQEIACVDSGCFRGMTPSHNGFLDYSPVLDGSHVIGASGEQITVAGRGTYCASINGRTCVFPDWLHIPHHRSK